jgi:small conductance mechanosensitive channel
VTTRRSRTTRTLALAGLVWVTLLALPRAQDAEAPPAPPARVVDPSIGAEELALRLVPLTSDELGAVADAWLGIVKAKTQEVIDAQIAVATADTAGAAAARARVVALVEERKPLFDNLSAVLTSWEKKGGDEARIAAMRAYRASVLVEETRGTDVQTLLHRLREWALSTDGGIGLLLKLLLVVVALLAAVTVARVARRMTTRVADHYMHFSKLLQAALAMAVYWIVLALGLMVLLTVIGVDISPVYALVGGASFILAFALQSTLGNLAAGLMIMVNRPFDVGDLVTVAGTMGTVKAVNIVSTTLTSPDNKLCIVPNASVWGNVITNVTANDTRRIDLTFSIGYDDDIEKAQHVLEDVVQHHPLVLKEPEPMIRMNELAASSVNFVVRPWVRKEDYWTVLCDLTQQIKQAFDANGISIPFPQQDIHVRDVSQLART